MTPEPIARRDVLAKWAMFRKMHVYLPVGLDIEIDVAALTSYPEHGIPPSIVGAADVYGDKVATEPQVPGFAHTSQNPNEMVVDADDETGDDRWKQIVAQGVALCGWDGNVVTPSAVRDRLMQLRLRQADDANDDNATSDQPPAVGLGEAWTRACDTQLEDLEEVIEYVKQPFLKQCSSSATVDLGDAIPLDEQAANAERNLRGNTHKARTNPTCLFRPHGAEFVDDYANPGLWEGSFPAAFVLGEGGFEFTFERLHWYTNGDARYHEEHLTLDQLYKAVQMMRGASKTDKMDQWTRRVMTLERSVKKAERHYTQVFQRHSDLFAMAFNMLQRHTACAKAHFYSLKDLDCNEISDLMRALRAEDPNDKEKLRALKLEENIKSIAGGVRGSAFSRLKVGGNLMGNTMTFGGHNLFLTVNPSEVNDLRCYTVAEELHIVMDIAMGAGLRDIVQPFTTECSAYWPDKDRHNRAAAANASAVAEYFHETVKLYLAAFLQFPLPAGSQAGSTGEGLFGHVLAYGGTVENQVTLWPRTTTHRAFAIRSARRLDTPSLLPLPVPFVDERRATLPHADLVEGRAT